MNIRCDIPQPSDYETLDGVMETLRRLQNNWFEAYPPPPTPTQRRVLRAIRDFYRDKNRANREYYTQQPQYQWYRQFSTQPVWQRPPNRGDLSRPAPQIHVSNPLSQRTSWSQQEYPERRGFRAIQSNTGFQNPAIGSNTVPLGSRHQLPPDIRSNRPAKAYMLDDS
jgi:hypothetical protein